MKQLEELSQMEKDLKLLKKDTKKSNNNFKKLKAIKIKK